MIHDTDNIHNIRHTILDLHNSCATLMIYNMSPKIQHSITIHNTYTDNTTIQQTKNTMQHETHVGLNALAVVQTLSITYTAQ